MPAHALAIANNDVVHIAWSVDHPIPHCTGFSIWRVPADGNGPEVPLQVLLTFVSEPIKAAPPGRGDHPVGPEKPQPANATPALIKGYKWRDLLTVAQRGVAVKYRIQAMNGPEANPVPIPDQPPIWTNVVTPTQHFGAIDATFNRGILSTQALAKLIPGKNGKPSVSVLQAEIAKPGSKVRTMLSGQMENAIQTLLDEREKTGGECYAALYELTDDTLIKRLEKARSKLHVVLSNNTGDTKKYDAANAPARARLAKSKAELISRYLPDGRSIGHNKFMVHVDDQGHAQAVLTGSTNWTASGMCTQNNNCVVLRVPKLAERYLAYWHDLKDDTEANPIPDPAKAVSALQGADLRHKDEVKPTLDLIDGNGGAVSVWPSPNTDGFIPAVKKGAPPTPPPTPPDMNELFQLIAQAKQAVLLLVFQPGAAGSGRSWTIVKQLSQVCHGRPDLFVRGAISDEAEAIEFEAARTNLMDAEMVAPAGIMKDLEPWEQEIYKAGHAIVHDKIVVIDPFSDDCVVVTGSHNLGYKASYNNDENLVIVRGNRKLAESYATHIADVFEHYRWRWYNKRSAERAAAAAWVKDGSDPATAGDKKYFPDNFFHASIQHDEVGDTWQTPYFDATRLACLERQFWAGGGQPLPPRVPSPGPGFTSGLTPAEITFRAAKGALRKKQKGGEDDGEEVEAPAKPRRKPASGKRPATKKKPAAKKKRAAKKKTAAKKKKI